MKRLLHFRPMSILYPLKTSENLWLFDVFKMFSKRALIGLKFAKYGHERCENKKVRWEYRD